MLLEKLKSSAQQRESHHGWSPGAHLRAPGGVQGQCPGRGPGGRALGSSGVLPILNALRELSWIFIHILFYMHIYDKKDTDYAGKKIQKLQDWW